MNLINSKYKISGALESLPGGREENQDFMGFADTQLGFVLVLCDGMGGGPGGLTASTTVVDAVIQHLSTFTKDDDIKTAIRQSITFADEKIAKLTTTSPALAGMGTTIVVLVINNKSAYVAHIGDSRLYQFRFGYKVFRTNDHSQVGELVRSGALTEEQARISPNSNVVTRAINGCGIAQPDIIELPYEKGDRFVLCSDGIWGSMPEKELIKGLTKTKSVSGTVVQMAFDVDEIGKAAGGKHDNLSIAIVETQANSKLKVKMGKKIRNVLLILVALLIASILGNFWTVSSICSSPKSSSGVDSLKGIITSLVNDTIHLKSELRLANQDIQSLRDSIYAKDLKFQNLQEQNKQLQATINEQEKKGLGNSLEKKNESSNNKNEEPSASQKSAKQRNAESAVKTIKSWVEDLNKENKPTTDNSIDQLINTKLAQYASSDNNIKNACSNLRSAKQSYKSRKYDEEKRLFNAAIKYLEKVK